MGDVQKTEEYEKKKYNPWEREREKGEKKKNINFIDLRTKKAAYFDV